MCLSTGFLTGTNPRQTNPNLSLGGLITTEDFVNDNFSNNLWPDTPATESLSGSIRYRFVYIYNNNDEATFKSATVYIKTLTQSDDDEIDIGIGSAAAGAVEPIITNDTIAPTGITFSRPITLATALSLGDIPPKSWRGFWIRRTVNANAHAAIANKYVLHVEGLNF